jgi:hypothetical protein
MRLFISIFVCLAIVCCAQDAGSKALLPSASRNYAASAATARGIRPDKDGKFQNLEVLWPVEVPAGDCNWRGSIRADGKIASAIMGASTIAQGKATVSLIFDGRLIGTSEKANWTFQGLIGCDSSGRDPGISAETNFIVQPSTYAKRAGLQLVSTIQILTSPGSEALAAIDVRTDATAPAVFEFVNPPSGFQPKINPMPAAGGKGVVATISVDNTVRPGRYFLPVKVTVGAEQGTADVVVDVTPEQ